ncbi:MAG: cupin domain-containing protein [Nitriliruptorales bacterium]|nr:cupin domain-containing protein [Nitriliruptorales bacterium]
MYMFDLRQEQHFEPDLHVEKVLETVAGGDVTVACWEPGQVSPYHCHPRATEIYFCFEGGGRMITPSDRVDVVPGAFVVHPPGELHEYTNGADRTLLFRVRYGPDVSPRTVAWPTNPAWSPSRDDLDYLRGQVAAGNVTAAVVEASRQHLSS